MRAAECFYVCGNSPVGTPDGPARHWDFRLGPEGPDTYEVSFVLTPHRCGRLFDREDKPTEGAHDAICMFGIAWISENLERIEELAGGRRTYILSINDREEEIDALRATKQCDYQAWRGRDLWCAAVFAGSFEGERAAKRVSSAACKRCELPDARVACSKLMHASLNLRSEAGKMVPKVQGAECDLGYPAARIGAAGCRPGGGHDCWRRDIRTEAGALETVTPLSLPEALDFLDAVWRNVGGARLFNYRSAVDLSQLGHDAADYGACRSRLNSLAEVLKAIDIADPSVPQEAKDDWARRNHKPGGLDRLEAFLGGRLEPTELDRAKGGITVLRAVNRLRVAVQHEPAKIPDRLEELGISLGQSWPARWNTVRALTVRALGEIRAAAGSLQSL